VSREAISLVDATRIARNGANQSYYNTFVLVTGDFVPTGGMDRANYALASFLAGTGRSTRLIAHRVAPELAAVPGVTVHLVSKPLGSYFLGQWPLAWEGERAGRFGVRLGWRTVVNGGNCCFSDVNWVHYIHAAYRPTMRGSWARRMKGRLEFPLNIRAERAALRAARIVVCNSELTRRHAIELCGVDPSRAVTIYYGSDPDRFRPATDSERTDLRIRLEWPTDRPVFAFVGALGDRRKGFDTLFAAWTQLCQSTDWDGLLVVIGSGAERPAWEARAAGAGLADRIRFLGFRSDMPDLLRAADVLVAPTRYEAYGLGVHEALCCGLPAVVSAAAGVAERFPSDLSDFLLPDPEDVTDLAARLAHCRENLVAARVRLRPLSDQLRAVTWDDMSQRFLEVIGEATACPAP
jgi:glycosyltransferase involved in cell wall biosynthesis